MKKEKNLWKVGYMLKLSLWKVFIKAIQADFAQHGALQADKW